jgi:hypothetical protein
MRSDPASAGLGKSRGVAFLLGFGIEDSFPFSFDLVLFYSNPNNFLLVLAVENLDLNQIESLRGPDSRTVLDSNPNPRS